MYWSSDVCSSDLFHGDPGTDHAAEDLGIQVVAVLMRPGGRVALEVHRLHDLPRLAEDRPHRILDARMRHDADPRFPESREVPGIHALDRSEEHTSELQSLMRISYAVFCLKKKKTRDQ